MNKFVLSPSVSLCGRHRPTQRYAAIHRGSPTLRRQTMWLSIDEVVHHDDVDRPAIVRTGSDIACNNPHTRDARIVELDPEERETAIARRGRDKTAEQQTAISTEKLYQRTGTTITLFSTWTTAVGLVHVDENRTESGDGRSRSSV